MSRGSEMRAFWDRGARDDALFYVDDRGLAGEAFWTGGEEIVDRYEADLGFTISGGTVVEIGCGVGRLTRVLARRADGVVALDVSPEMLALAREHNPGLPNVRWVLGDGRSLTGVGA